MVQQFLQLLSRIRLHGRSNTPLNQAFEWVKFITIVNSPDIFGKFFDVKIFILENVILLMPLSVIYQKRAPFFWLTRYTQRKINTSQGFMK